MSILLFYTGVYFLVLVNTHPLIQNIQPFPITNYQQNVYRSPYSEAYIVQPSDINHYSAQVSIQTPLTTYQVLQVPSLTDQLSQIYWDKLVSIPSVRKILDSNNIALNQYDDHVLTNLQPCNTRGVVNNYIIIPPEYFKINETIAKEPKNKREKNKILNENSVKENITSNQRKKKVSSNNKENTQEVQTSKGKSRKKLKKNTEQSWSFITDNIKCFTPADVLDNENYQPQRKADKNKETVKEGCRKTRNRNQKSTSNCKNKDGSEKSRKTTRNKVKKILTERENNICKQNTENIFPSSTSDKNKKQIEKPLNVYKCVQRDELSDYGSKIVENIPKSYEPDANEVLLSNLFQQGCTNLENRQTRNSKSDTVMKDFRNMYPDLPGDISKTLASYMSDFFSPHSLQQVPPSNLFLGNTYPLDLTQIYQIPQYSNADVSKPKGNTERNRNTRRRKKKKKNSKSKTRKENDNNRTDNNNSQNPVQSIKTLKTNTQSLESSNQTSKTVQQSVMKSSRSKLAPELTTSMDEVSEYFDEPTQNSVEMLEKRGLVPCDDDLKSEEKESKEIFETQIPYSVVGQIYNESNSEISEYEGIVNNNTLPTQSWHILNNFSEMGSEDAIFNILMHYPDYFPDFRADNHAYLESDEEMDMHNLHDRYFYVTDKNIDSMEVYSPEREGQYYNHRGIYADDDESEEVIFRTPPRLEVPDFVTRKVNKDRQNSNEIYYQNANFQDDYDKFNLDSFADNSENVIRIAKRTDDNNSGHLVETAYAKSKVVKYGQGYEFTKPYESEVKSSFPKQEDVVIGNDEGKTVIIAKSLRPEEYW